MHWEGARGRLPRHGAGRATGGAHTGRAPSICSRRPPGRTSRGSASFAQLAATFRRRSLAQRSSPMPAPRRRLVWALRF